MLIDVQYSEFLHLFGIEPAEKLAPGLDIRPTGVFQVSERDPNDSEKLIVAFPFDLDELEVFAIDHGVVSRIDAFRLIKLVKKEAVVKAIARIDEHQTYLWPVVEEVDDLRRDLKKQVRLETEKPEPDNSRIVALREVVDGLDAALAEVGDEKKLHHAEEKPLATLERQSLLRVILALLIIAKLPERGAISPIEHQIGELGLDGPRYDTINKSITAARKQNPKSES